MISVVFIEYKKPEEAILWVFVLLVFPLLGMILYAVFGNTLRLKLSYWRKNKELKKAYAEVLQKQIQSLQEVPNLGTNSIGSSMVRFNLNYSDSILMKKNEVAVFCWGQQKYADMFAAMRQAQKSIHVEYYAIDPDKVGKELISILTERAQNGVDVKVIVDGFGCLKAPNSLFRPLREAGGIVKRSKPFGTHFRNHRKIVVIDGEIGYTGGMNIGIPYLSEVKIRSPWRDTHIKMRGDGVYALQYIFLTDWIAMSRKKNSKTRNEKNHFLFSAS